MKKKYTFEELREIALMYKTKGEFKKSNRKAYFASTHRKDYDLIVEHMPKYLNRFGKETSRINWMYEKIKMEALKYNRRIDFVKGNKDAYYAASRMGILDEICAHMNPSKTKRKELKKIEQEALKYK